MSLMQLPVLLGVPVTESSKAALSGRLRISSSNAGARNFVFVWTDNYVDTAFAWWYGIDGMPYLLSCSMTDLADKEFDISAAIQLVVDLDHVYNEWQAVFNNWQLSDERNQAASLPFNQLSDEVREKAFTWVQANKKFKDAYTTMLTYSLHGNISSLYRTPA